MGVAAEALTKSQTYETDYPLESATHVGERALWGAGVFKPELGVNDPLTHLEQYLEHGEAVMVSVDEDLITDCAERLLKPQFIHSVAFERIGNDFISRENRFSMREMTQITEDKFTGNTVDMQLYKRTKIESKEVDRLNNWFPAAKAGDVFVVESMNLTKSERYTLVRIHEKLNENELTEHIITLHKASVPVFNQLHAELGAVVPASQTVLELLDNMYNYTPPAGQTTADFLQHYVNTYDYLLAAKGPDTDYRFGLTPGERPRSAGDDMAMVRSQTALRSVYHDSVKALGRSNGRVTTEIINIENQLGLGMNLTEDEIISSAMARGLLDSILQHIMATLNRAPQATLNQLASSGSKAGAMAYANRYGGEASAAGIRYDGACPTGSATEAVAIAHGLRKDKDPSRCGICPKCSQEYFVPDKIYKEKILECNNCHAAIYFDGKAVPQSVLDKLHGVETEKLSMIDAIITGIAKAVHEIKLKQLVKGYNQQTDELERRHQVKLIQQEQAEIQRLSLVT